MKSVYSKKYKEVMNRFYALPIGKRRFENLSNYDNEISSLFHGAKPDKGNVFLFKGIPLNNLTDEENSIKIKKYF